MKANKLTFTILIFFSGVFFSSLIQANDLNIVCEKDWRPYIYSDQNNNISGYSYDLVTYVLDNNGIKYKITSYPWKRALKMVIAGKADALFNASKETLRELKCHYPEEPLLYSKYHFFILKNNNKNIKYETLDDLKAYNIGVTLGYSYTKEFLDFIEKNKKYDSARSDYLNFKKLLMGKIDLFPAELGNAMVILNELNGFDKVTYLKKPLTQKPYYIIFNKMRIEKNIVNEFSKNLKHLKTTSEFNKITNKYFK